MFFNITYLLRDVKGFRYWNLWTVWEVVIKEATAGVAGNVDVV